MAEKSIPVLKNAEISAFCSQMYMLLSSGISSIEGISLMMEDGKNKEEKEILTRMYDSVIYTGSLYEAMCESKVFPAYALEMVQIGESTGRLDESLKALSDHYRREESISKAIRNAVTYPLVMIGMMIVVVLVLIIKVLPIFESVFEQLGSQMSGFSKAMLDMGNGIRNYSIYFVVLLWILVFVMMFFGMTNEGKKISANVITKLPYVKRYRHKLYMCRFASGMAMTLSSGMSSEEALQFSTKLVPDKDFKDKIDQVSKGLSEGGDLAPLLVQAGVLTGVYARLASIGEKTGKLDEVMYEIADRCQSEVDDRLTSMINAIEPALVIILSLIVGMILLSVMLPLVSVMSGL